MSWRLCVFSCKSEEQNYIRRRQCSHRHMILIIILLQRINLMLIPVRKSKIRNKKQKIELEIEYCSSKRIDIDQQQIVYPCEVCTVISSAQSLGNIET